MKRQVFPILAAAMVVGACTAAPSNQLGAAAEIKAQRFGIQVDGDSLSPSQAARINSIKLRNRSDAEVRALIRSALRERRF